MVKFLGVVIFTWLFTDGAAPIQLIKKLLYIHNESEPKKLITQQIQKLVNCSLCSGFWIGLAFYQDFYMACIISLSSEALCRIIKKLSNYFTEL